MFNKIRSPFKSDTKVQKFYDITKYFLKNRTKKLILQSRVYKIGSIKGSDCRNVPSKDALNRIEI